MKKKIISIAVIVTLLLLILTRFSYSAEISYLKYVDSNGNEYLMCDDYDFDENNSGNKWKTIICIPKDQSKVKALKMVYFESNDGSSGYYKLADGRAVSTYGLNIETIYEKDIPNWPETTSNKYSEYEQILSGKNVALTSDFNNDTSGTDPYSECKHEKTVYESSGDEGHFVKCADCGKKIEFKSHRFEGNGTNCKDCNYTKRSSSHTHVASSNGKYFVDGSYHYQICINCGEKFNVGTHDNNSTGGACSKCGVSATGREHEHNWSSSYKSDGQNGHYRECTVAGCTARTNVYSHQYPSDGNTCIACGYVNPDRKQANSQTNLKEINLDQIVKDAENFLDKGSQVDEDSTMTGEQIQDLSNLIYNVLLVIGIVVAVVIGGILGIQFITSGAEGKADIKQMLVPYVIGVVVLFGAFTIWKIVLVTLQGS